MYYRCPCCININNEILLENNLQKHTLFFVNFYLFIANFELFPKKSVFWSDLFIGLRYNCINRTKYHLLIFEFILGIY